jgi:hypothetical protein
LPKSTTRQTGGTACWRNLDEVNAGLAGKIQRIVQRHHAKLLAIKPMTRTSRARIFPLILMNEAGEELRGGKGRLKTPSSVEKSLYRTVSNKPAQPVDLRR